MVLPALQDSCLFVWYLLFVGGTDGNCNFPAVHNPIELKLGRELGLLSQISEHVLVSSFNCFSYCKPKKTKKILKLQKS
jgi:hypothetical protein